MRLNFFDKLMRLRGLLQLPAMTAKERRAYKALLQVLSKTQKPVRIFEYGSGFSTLYFAKYLKRCHIPFEFHSVDNNAFWHQKVKAMVKAAGLEGQVHLHLQVFEPFWNKPGWSFTQRPKPGEFAPSLPQENAYINGPQLAGGNFDLIVIDGRFRQRCLQVAAKSLSPQGIVLLHDAQKKHYQPPVGVLPHSAWVEGGRFYAWQQWDQRTWLGSGKVLPVLH